MANYYMKKLKYIISLLIIKFNLFSQTDKPKIQAIELRGSYMDIYYINEKPKIANGMIFTGIDSTYFMDGKEKLLVVETFKDGFKIELKTFYDNGNPETHFQWKNSKRDGVSKKWYKSGKIMFEDIMKGGETIGTHILFYENGNPHFIDDKKKSGIYMEFYEDGKLHSLSKHFNDSIKCDGNDGFEETVWHENGQLMVRRIENCGRQSFKSYYNDSTLFSEGTEIGMGLFKVSKYTEWYINGKFKLEAHYDENKVNVKTGVWKYYNDKGQLIKEEVYENNELKKIKEYIKEKKSIVSEAPAKR